MSFRTIFLTSMLLCAFSAKAETLDFDAKAKSFASRQAADNGGLLVSFIAKNSQNMTVLGIDIVNVEVEFSVRFPNGYNAHCIEVFNSIGKVRTTMELLKSVHDCERSLVVEKNGEHRFEMSIPFEKTNNGWRGPDKRIY